MATSSYKRLGDQAFSKVEHINSELFMLTYGALVAQVVKDSEDAAEANRQLDQMGYNIGVRLVDEFLARSGIGKISTFRETAEIIAKVGFKMFLNVIATVGNWSGDKEYSLLFDENPLAEFVELPRDDATKALFYSNLLCGVLRGALESVHMKVECRFVKDTLHGDDCTEIRVVFKEMLLDTIPASDD
eukprot:TRINITY_DN1278_c1_g1_i6.p1 TRINITY_DN1278_c1_g1~~TRINITY_DN1278_c1_g1_i6.p1  ORF type:complete len:188 (+),score=53.61 TRINITY_DN1278_c1_g1_i6:106-669(+)